MFTNIHTIEPLVLRIWWPFLWQDFTQLAAGFHAFISFTSLWLGFLWWSGKFSCSKRDIKK